MLVKRGNPNRETWGVFQYKKLWKISVRNFHLGRSTLSLRSKVLRFEMVSYTWTWRIIWRRLLTKAYMLVMLFEVATVILQKATHAHAQEDWPGIWRSSGLTATLYLQIGFWLEKTTLFFLLFYHCWFHCRLGFSWAYLAWLSVVDYLAALWTAYPVFSFRGVTPFLAMICQLPLIFLLAFLYIFFIYFIQLRLSGEVRSPRYLSSLILLLGLVCYIVFVFPSRVLPLFNLPAFLASAFFIVSNGHQFFLTFVTD